ASIKNTSNTQPEHGNAEDAPQVTQTVEEQVQIVTFDSDLAEVQEDLPFPSQIPLTPSIQHTDDSVHSVISFLKRPQLLSSFRWASTAERSANLFTPAGRTDGLLVPTGLFQSHPMIARKLDGFTSFRATCVLKLQVNSQPFQCGRLLMAASPVPGLLGNRNRFIFSHVSNAQNLNHVQMDIAKDTEVELRIPFISPYNSFDLIDGKFDWAEVRILVYSPLNAVAATCLQCLVYGHFEDIEMGAPTSGSVKQQSRMPSARAIDETKKKEARGGFTGALAQLGSSVINGGAKLAIAAMGWSKPILASPSQVVLERPTEGFNYMDGVDQSIVLGMTGSNAIEPIPGLVGTAIDETAFNTLKRIPQMVSAFTYSDKIITCENTDRNPVMLWQCAVSPSCNVPACYYLIPQADSTTGVVNPYQLSWKQPTTLNYITAPFLYWTGSLVYTFKFIKTDFHSGRVEISYHPFVNTVATDRFDYVYRTVVDLRKNSEVSVTIPYIAAQPWKRISTWLDPINPDPPAPGRLKDVICGMLYVRALTPLICATSIISPNIEVCVEMRAGDDFEVSGPVTSKFLPFSFQNPKQQSADFRVPSSIGRIYEYWARGTAIAQMRGLKDFPLVSVNINGDLTRASNEAFANARIWYLVLKWENIYPTLANVDQEKYAFIYSMWSNGYSYTQDVIIDNPNNNDILYCFLLQNFPATNVPPNMLHTVDICAYGRTRNQQIDLNPTQFPIPTTGGGGGGSSVVTIDPASLPLKVEVEQPSGPLNVVVEEQPIEVKLDSSQVPLPVASEGGVASTVKIDPSQIPLKVEVDNEPLKAVIENTVRTTIDPSQIPLPVTGGGGGGGGGVVTINPEQLPLWTSPNNLAPLNPREQSNNSFRENTRSTSSKQSLPVQSLQERRGFKRTTICLDFSKIDSRDIYRLSPDNVPAFRNARQQSGQLAMAGVTETRTRAMEGWMPPSITGSESDAHRPSTVKWCTGEKFETYRQYAKRFAFNLVTGLASDKPLPIQPVEMIRPGALTLRVTPGTVAGNDRTQYALYAFNSNAEVSGSPLAYASSMFAFYRGSVRVKAWLDPRADNVAMISGHLEYARQDIDNNITNDTIENFMTPIAYEVPSKKQIAEYQIPYYSPTIISSTWSHGVDNQFDVPLTNLVIGIPDTYAEDTTVTPPVFKSRPTTYPFKLAVAAGDDMDFHQFIGPPPVINLGNLTTTARIIHYPPTGFTPTQHIEPDTARSEEAATRFVPVDYSVLRVVGNITGASCGDPPTFRRRDLPENATGTMAEEKVLSTPPKQQQTQTSTLAVVTNKTSDNTPRISQHQPVRTGRVRNPRDVEGEGYDTVDDSQPVSNHSPSRDHLSYYSNPQNYILE
ncbi:structural polyprotein, partial [Myrmica scabrinodis virus 2]